MTDTRGDRLGDWIVQLRTAWGSPPWTKERITERGGPSTATQGRIEGGKRRPINPDDETVHAYARALPGVTVDMLYDVMDGKAVPVPSRPPSDVREMARQNEPGSYADLSSKLDLVIHEIRELALGQHQQARSLEQLVRELHPEA